MACVLIIGGGLAGCTAALELANHNTRAVIVEKSDRIGGKVRYYGCKATNRCNKCGLCMIGDLWSQVEKNGKIEISTGSQVMDIRGEKGDFTVVVKDGKGSRVLSGITDIVVSTGFDEFSAVSAGSLEFDIGDHIITGNQLEKLIARRGKHGVFAQPPASAAFIQCFGSRDIQEKAAYCSRVCCGYSTRAARVLRQYYPEMKITFFYMDLQEVEGESYFDCLQQENMEFVKCRPVSVKPGKPNRILYEQTETHKLIEQEYELLVLSEGIHPSRDAEGIAEICRLGLDENGFLKYVGSGKKSGIYMAGCVSGPKRIQETYSESLQVAREICGGVL